MPTQPQLPSFVRHLGRRVLDLGVPHVPRSTSDLFPERVLPMAHRGWSGIAPENTMPAFLAAAERGYGIELDTCLSRDGELVVIHDDTLDRTTNGHGPVDAQTAAELAELDAGSWFHRDFTDTRIPTLREVLTATAHRVLVDIEIKSPRRDGPWNAEDLARSTVALLRELGLTRRVFVTSFNPYVLAAVRQAAPEIRRGWLFCREDDQLWWYQRRILRHLRLNHWVAPDLLAPEHALCDPDHTAWRRRQGYRMLTWTVDDPDHMRSLITQGVRAIISNHPDRVEAVAGQI